MVFTGLVSRSTAGGRDEGGTDAPTAIAHGAHTAAASEPGSALPDPAPPPMSST